MEKESPKKARGVFSKKGVQIATRLTWAFQDVPLEGDCFWRKQPGSPGRAGWQALPLFSYK